MHAGAGGSGSVSSSASGSSIDKDEDEGGRLSMGLFANGILFGLQVPTYGCSATHG